MKWSKKGLIYNNSHSQLPIVQKEGSWYKCYLTSRNKNNQSYIKKIKFQLNPLQVFDYGCVLKPSNIYDCDGVMTSCVITLKGVEYLYYTSWKKMGSPFYKHNICLAIDFAKINEPIIKSHSNDFGICSSPFILIENKWRMWFISGQNSDGWIENNGILCPTYTMHYAESDDGIHWSRKKIFFPRKPREIFSRPFVFKQNETYKMFYSKLTIDKEKLYTIGYAESKDGLSWRRLDAQAGITTSKEGWDNKSIAFPWIVDNFLFYSGNNFGKEGFGYAEQL